GARAAYPGTHCLPGRTARERRATDSAPLPAVVLLCGAELSLLRPAGVRAAELRALRVGPVLRDAFNLDRTVLLRSGHIAVASLWSSIPAVRLECRVLSARRSCATSALSAGPYRHWNTCRNRHRGRTGFHLLGAFRQAVLNGRCRK